MLLAFGIVLIVTGAAVDSLSQNPVLCRFAEDKTCYAAVGQRLELTFPQGFNFTLMKSESSVEQVILKYIKQIPPIVNPSGWNFVTDIKTVIISGAKKHDSGTYRLEISQQDGKTSTVSLHLNVEVPVSSVDVSYSCLPPERTVYCTAKGDELQFYWTSLSQQLDNRNSVLPLDEPEVINITCHVKNHVSSGYKTIQLQKCPDSLSQNPLICRFAEDKTCYAAVGQRLELPFPQGLNFILKKRESSVEQVVLTFRKGTSAVNPSGWSFVTDNRTVIISGAKKHDSGTYRLEISQQDGKTSTVSLQLNVEVPVSSVDVSYSCLPPESSVSCTAEGDELQFSWTSLSQQLDNRNSILRLNEPEVINITCHVENHVSSGNKTIQIQKYSGICLSQSDNGFNVFVAVWLFEVIILLSLLVGAFYIYTRIYKKQRAAERENQ